MQQQNATELAAAQAYGFRIEHGSTDDGVELAGKWWWTLFQDGWSGVETSPETFETYEQVEASVVTAYRQELAQGLVRHLETMTDILAVPTKTN